MLRTGLTFALMFSVAVGAASFARAEDAADIVKALTPKPKPKASPLTTRGLNVRGIIVGDGGAETPPQIDLTVNFEFDSAKLTEAGVAQLSKLGVALNDPALKGYSFRVVGHTDARGAPDYNVGLSERRADAVGAYLQQYYSVNPSRLALEGRGASQLKDPAHPEDGVNRRVQVVTLTH